MPSIEVEEVGTESTPRKEEGEGTSFLTGIAEQQELVKSAVKERFDDLVARGSSPTSAAASAIRDVRNKATSKESGSADEAQQGTTPPAHATSEDATARLLRFHHEENTSTMQHSSSAPTLHGSHAAGSGRAAVGHRNKDVWKTFGIHLPAGRLLKNLYGGGFDGAVPGTLKHYPPRRVGPPSEVDTYMAVNNLKVGTAGLQYRKSMNIFDLCKDGEEYVRWGDFVQGQRVDASWLKVGDDRYLPTTVNKIQLLKRYDGPATSQFEGLRRQQSLPPLKKRPKDRATPQLSVGGIAYGL